MQMNEQVLTALEVLRNFAENDFERHRIDVLEKDLTPYREKSKKNDKHYYNKSERSIHKEIWEYYFGEIPKGYDIHHKNLNPSDNDISNHNRIYCSNKCNVKAYKQRSKNQS